MSTKEAITVNAVLDPWSILYAGCQIYTFGYRLLRPNPTNWGASLTDLISRISEISNRVNRLMEAIEVINSSIQALPETFRVVQEATMARQAIERAQTILEQLTPYFEKKSYLEANLQEVNGRMMVALEEAAIWAKWYERNPNGPVSFVMTLSGVLGQFMPMYNYLQVALWERTYVERAGHKPDQYPFEDIMSHNNLILVKNVSKVYDKLLKEINNLDQDHSSNASELFPGRQMGDRSVGHMPDDQSINSLHNFKVYDFDYISFTESNSGTGLFEPKIENLDKYHAAWWIEDGNQVKVSLYASAYEGTRREATASVYMTAYDDMVYDKRKFEVALARVRVLANSRAMMSRIKLINENMDKHRENVNKLNGWAWEVNNA